MASHSQDPDPGGDTLLILRNANAPFATCRREDLWPDYLPQYRRASALEGEETLVASCGTPAGSNRSQESEPTVSDGSNDVREVRMRLSSRHLILASAYFKRRLTPGSEEANPDPEFSYVVQTQDWDADALLALMRVIHGRVDLVPRNVSLEFLAKIAILVDYYGCHEVVALFSETWLRNLPKDLPLHYGRDLLLRLFVSWVFPEPDVIRRLTRIALFESRGPLHQSRLPLPAWVFGRYWYEPPISSKTADFNAF